MLLDKNTLTLLRIPFAFFLMPLFLLALSQSAELKPVLTIVGPAMCASSFWSIAGSFLIIHLLVYPASNGYNSYIDKDEESIGGLEKPPAPTKKLYYITLLMDITAFILAFICINVIFGMCILLYILASRAYSSKEIRLKKYPYTGFLVVVFFQGAFTFYMSYIGITNNAAALNVTTLWLLTACSFQIAGAYPLTQIYQHQQDYKDGVITISYKLGYIGTFVFSGLMFVLTNICYFMYFNAIHKMSNFYLIQLFFFPIIVYYIFWFSKVVKNTSAANFKNTMYMNIIAATCMNSCFFILYLINRIA